MPIYKRCSRCGKRQKTGSLCTCEARNKEELKAKSKESEFYKSKEWQKAREQAVRHYLGLDIYSYYIKQGIEYGSIVHHITPVKNCWAKRLSQSNLMLLTDQNHALIHKQLLNGETKIVQTLYELRELWGQETGLQG